MIRLRLHMPQAALSVNADIGRAACSGLLPVIRDHVAEQPGCKVLDLGYPNSGILEYLRGTPCRVYYNTEKDALAARMQNGCFDSHTGASLECGFSGMRFDVVLVWDYFEYISTENLHALGRQISAWCLPGALFYLQTHQGSTMPATPVKYQIFTDSKGAVRLENQIYVKVQPARRTAANRLLECLPGFTIYKLHLMQDVRQEHLFLYTGS